MKYGKKMNEKNKNFYRFCFFKFLVNFCFEQINFFAADFKRKSGLDINESKRATSRLQAEVIRVKTGEKKKLTKEQKRNTYRKQAKDKFLLLLFSYLISKSNFFSLVLSQIGEAKVQIEGLLEGLDLNGSITRARFEGMNSSLFSNVSEKNKTKKSKETEK